MDEAHEPPVMVFVSSGLINLFETEISRWLPNDDRAGSATLIILAKMRQQQRKQAAFNSDAERAEFARRVADELQAEGPLDCPLPRRRTWVDRLAGWLGYRVIG